MHESTTPEPKFSWLTKGQEWTGPNDTSGTDYAADFWDATVDQLELSGTGFEEKVFAAVYEYLKFSMLPEPPLQRSETMFDIQGRADFTEKALAAELASKAGFTEYGVSMRTAWTDEPGKAWMRDYENWLATE